MTVVVVSHNSSEHFSALGDALRAGSLQAQRLLVVDNASRDDSVERARSAGFDLYESRTNDGFGAACNAALEMADTEFVLICNPDVRPSPTAIEGLVRSLEETTTAAVAGPVFNRRFRARRFSRITGELYLFLPRRLQGAVRRFDCEIPVAQSEESVVVDFVVGAFMLCRVAALRSVGGFDESFFLYSEEEDLCRRLGERGWQTIFVPSAAVDHRRSTSSDGVEPGAMTPFRFHSLYWYYRKYHSRLYAELARCALAVCVTIDRSYRALTGRQQVYGRATARALFLSIDRLRSDYDRDHARASGGDAPVRG